MQMITERDEAAQAFRDLAERLKGFPALACSCRTLAGATEEWNEVELGRKIADHGKARRTSLAALARRLRKDVEVLSLSVDPKAALRIDDETGVMSLMFDDLNAAAALAFAYNLEIDGGDVVVLGPVDSADLPIPYRHLEREWKRLADAWDDAQRDAWEARVNQDRFERSQMGPL